MNEEELIEFSKKYAEEQGFKLNPNEAVVNAIIKGLLKREAEEGEKYCPCRVNSGDKEEDKKNICPCFWHKEEIERDGHCKSRLFVKGD